MSRENGFDKDPKRAKKAGEKSKRKPLDQNIKEKLEECFDGSAISDLITWAQSEFKKGNSGPLFGLFNRGLGSPTSRQEIRNLTMEDNPLYQQLKEITKQNKK